ncbi:hypothetical protein ALC62_11686 [Cyphomyrmex costatus]|uniref:Ig-like domain-containing protein n=1 Tax=Cyphomyrmex costatus TaxID=456900 RepID=A0A195C9K3_9HYME|nr:hypothetical protein ALC62_11686 [Cyphomyrmex costatus]
MLSRLSAVVAFILVHQIYFLCTASTLLGAKQFPGFENLPRSFWHELSSPFTEVYEVESFVTETGGTPEPRPFFEDPESNITVQLGAQVYMHCRVQNLQNTLKFSNFEILIHYDILFLRVALFLIGVHSSRLKDIILNVDAMKAFSRN